ncbi:glycine cleavage system protein H [Crossiella cryophila]|uniref:Glycine cleavage system H protein n=1 Tax=Crossiella cryophila TaxID=43355 RepID=A0A7W7CFV3_9PSEU|nr:glycine cleavage system protein H [Crossiella cryophila]MBB4680457.1 glycine cleavage system H protein [Crossiella cryophila]
MFVDFQTLRFTRDHTWVRHRGDTLRVGLTDVLTRGLTDLVEVGLPPLGGDVHLLAPCGFLATRTWFGDLFAPMSGLVVERNERLFDDPGLIVRDPYDTGWLFEIRTTGDPLLDTLDGADYLELVSQVP